MLNRDPCVEVFRASAERLKQYSAKKCSTRLIQKPKTKSAQDDLEEEQSLYEILCAIQLLLDLFAKDFIDTFSSDTGNNRGEKSVEPNEVTEVICLDNNKY